MDCNVRHFFSSSMYRWLVALGVGFIASKGFASSFEQNDQVSNLFTKAEINDTRLLNNQLNEIQRHIVRSPKNLS